MNTSEANSVDESLSLNMPVKADANSHTPSAQILVLSNADLLDICFSFLDPHAFFNDIWEIGTSTRRRLLATALTCRAFFEPAMGLLWRMMESIIPALKILPRFVKANENYTINGPITPSHLDRLRLYTKNIRYLYLCGSQDSIAGHTLLRLSHLTPPIFPALIAVQVSIPTLILRTVENLNCLFLAGCSHSLKILSFTDVSYATEDFLASFLSFASQGRAKVEDIILKGRLTENSLGMLRDFDNLKRVELAVQSTTIQKEVISGCARMQALETLCIKLDSFSIVEDDSDGLGFSGSFAALKTLELCGPAAELVKLLRRIRTTTLQSITVSFPTSMGWASADTICASIEACALVSPLSLRHLKLHGGSRGGSAVSLPRGSLLSLVACTEMRSLEFSGVVLGLTDGDIGQICEASAWKWLEVLRLPHSPQRNTPSFLAVHMLVMAHPHLQTLSLSLDFGIHDYTSLRNERLTLPLCTNALRDLTIYRPTREGSGLTLAHGHNNDFESTSMSLAIGVAGFMERHLRELDQGSLQYITDFAGEADWWLGVKKLVEELREVRDEESQQCSQCSYVAV